MEKQKEKFRELEEREENVKVREIKEKEAWRNILQKAEGQKIKDDPILLKKSIKKMVWYFLDFIILIGAHRLHIQ